MLFVSVWEGKEGKMSEAAGRAWQLEEGDEAVSRAEGGWYVKHVGNPTVMCKVVLKSLVRNSTWRSRVQGRGVSACAI